MLVAASAGVAVDVILPRTVVGSKKNKNNKNLHYYRYFSIVVVDSSEDVIKLGTRVFLSHVLLFATHTATAIHLHRWLFVVFFIGYLSYSRCCCCIRTFFFNVSFGLILLANNNILFVRMCRSRVLLIAILSQNQQETQTDTKVGEAAAAACQPACCFRLLRGHGERAAAREKESLRGGGTLAIARIRNFITISLIFRICGSPALHMFCAHTYNYLLLNRALFYFVFRFLHQFSWVALCSSDRVIFV